MINGKWPEEKTLIGYQEMYDDINKEKCDIVLEIGTNHAEFNAKELNKLQKKYKVIIIVCKVDDKISLERYIQRKRINSKEIYDLESLQKRLDRKFPDSHLHLLKEYNIPFIIIDTAPSITKLTALLEKALTDM